MQDIRTMIEEWFGIVPGNSATDPPVFKKGMATPTTNADVAALDDLLNLVAPDKLETGITAFAGGGQASAAPLTALISNVTVCATAGDSVKLPVAAAGKCAIVRNSGAANLNVFPASGDAINALAVNLSVIVPPLCSVSFFAIDGTTWYAEIGKGVYLSAPTTQTGGVLFRAVANAANYVVEIINAAFGQATVLTIPDPGASTASFLLNTSVQTLIDRLNFALATGITAATTQTIAAATALTKQINNVSTVANAADAVALPAAAAGGFVIVRNSGANALQVFPSNGASDTIDGGSADASISLAVGETRVFIAISTTAWLSAQFISSGIQSIAGVKTFTSNCVFGDATTDTYTHIGRMIVRTVTDAGPMTATPGTQAEVVFNSSDSKFYGCTVTHAATATWVALN